MPLEISAFSLTSALIAAPAAQRIELCAGPRSSGGLTPSRADYSALRKQTKLPIYVMLRPHARSFVYDSSDITAILDAISSFQELADGPPDGFVFGILTADNHIDAAACRTVISAIKKTQKGGRRQPCTFHRAFDEIPASDRRQAANELVELGFAAVLTGGGKGSVADNVQGLRDTIEAAGERLEIVAGGGVRSANIEELARKVGRKPAYWHSAAMLEDGDQAEADKQEVARLRTLVNGLDGSTGFEKL